MGQIVVNQSFKNFEEFASSVQSWDADFFQIEQGPLCTNLIQYISGDILFTRASIPVETRGIQPGYRLHSDQCQRKSYR